MNTLITLVPGTVFHANANNSNFNTLIFTVPKDRGADDPFYVIPEVETDQFIYWTGADDLGNNVQYFIKKENVL